MKRVAAQPATVRVAIYTRQSVDEDESEFKSVDAQRDTIEAYVKSQASEGWRALPDRFDDAGFTGANTNRPAFKRLLADVDAGRIDVIAVSKTDRLSRSLADFVSLMQRFEKHGVTFVSVTQQFATSTPTGRMTLNLLATFGEFEREMIAERTASKMIAIRRRGMFAGGYVPLGYDLVSKKLVVNADEAEQVRSIFRLYLEKGSLLATVDELNSRGWRTKSWTGKKGQHVAGSVYSIESLRQMLDRVVYIGLVRARKETYPGVHEPIIDKATWDAVQAQKRRLTPWAGTTNKYGALLKGLLFCGLCDSTMYFAACGRRHQRRTYYDCNLSRRFGRSQCAGRPVPVAHVEDFVIAKVREIGRDPALVRATADAVRAEQDTRAREVEAELRRQEHERRRIVAERKNLIDAVAQGGAGTNALMERVGAIDEQLAQIDARVRGLVAQPTPEVDPERLTAALAEFDGVWDELFAKEKARVLALLIERITYASTTGALKITFRTTGLKGVG